MLVLSRKQGQSVTIADNIEVMVLEVKHGKVRLGFRCRDEVKILRHEVEDRSPPQHIPSIAEHIGAGMWDGEPN